jgi:hypothetical protein
LLRIDYSASHPIQDLGWGTATIFPLLVSVVSGGIEGFDKLRMPILDLFEGLGLLKLEIGQPELDLEL